MKKNDDILNDDVEILDFDDMPQENKTNILKDEDVEILDFEFMDEKTQNDIKEENIESNNNLITENEEEIQSIEKLENNNEIKNVDIISENNTVNNDNFKSEDNNIDEQKKDDIKIQSNNNLNEAKIEDNKDIKKDEVFINENLINEPTKFEEPKTKRKLNLKTIFSGILIFIILVGVIIALPFLNNYVVKDNNTTKDNNINNSNINIDSNNINIDVKKSLLSVKDYTNYKYQNINDIYSKDNKESTLAIKNTYTFLFNETKFSVEINKKVSDFDYNVKDYYEKLDDVYNIYINDVTTNKINKRTTTKEEFDNLINMYPKVIEYLANNHEIIEKKEIKVDDKAHSNITLETPKEILNILSIETDRIQNKIDISKLSIDKVKVELFYDEKDKLYEIDFVIEDKAACLEELNTEINSAILKYIFKDLNKIEDIELPIE